MTQINRQPGVRAIVRHPNPAAGDHVARRVRRGVTILAVRLRVRTNPNPSVPLNVVGVRRQVAVNILRAAAPVANVPLQTRIILNKRRLHLAAEITRLLNLPERLHHAAGRRGEHLLNVPALNPVDVCPLHEVVGVIGTGPIAPKRRLLIVTAAVRHDQINPRGENAQILIRNVQTAVILVRIAQNLHHPAARRAVPIRRDHLRTVLYLNRTKVLLKPARLGQVHVRLGHEPAAVL